MAFGGAKRERFAGSGKGYLTMKVRLRIIIGIVTVSLAPHGLGAGTLRMGSTHNQPVEEIRRFLPLASYLEKQLKADGISQVQVVVSGTLREAAKHLREGTIDTSSNP